MSGMEEVVQEFLVESHENLDQLDRDLVALEKDPTSREMLARVFRTIHTIKGTCGFLGFSKLESVTHVGESLLSRLRDGEMALTPKIAGSLLEMVDAVRQILAGIEATRSEGGGDFSGLIETLNRLQADAGPKLPRAADAPAPPGAGPAPGEVEAAGHSRASESAVRVDVALLDRLMNLVGELVLVRNQILKHGSSRDGAALHPVSQHLSHVTTELQEGILKTRMQPLGNVWSKFPRLVRDVGAACGKKVRLAMDGIDTELDRSILEAIKDPLTHLVRNAVDHGIETPPARAAAGKTEEGLIALRAYHEGGQVNIEVSDDGAGIDVEKLRHRAEQRRLLAPGEAARLGEREAINLVFLPGLSTAKSVTNVSGRGVGMDVVKTNVEKIGGSVDVQSRPGRGTTIRIKLPLTLAIVPALIAGSRGERYAIPQASLLELVRLEGDAAWRGIETVHGAPVHRLRGSLLPIVHLDRELGGANSAAPVSRPPHPVLNIVVLQADGRPFGLVVDDIHDTEEIVVKPLGRHLRALSPFAGATILGDGKVALILDVLGLAQRAHVLAGSRERVAAEARPAAEPAAEEGQTLLVFGLRGGGRMALPLSMVARLEEFPRSALEKAGTREVVQYRSGILPLVSLSRLLGEGDAAAAQDPVQVVVYSEDGRSVGFVVDHILDIVSEPLLLRSRGGREGVLGAAIIQQRVTEVLDIESVLRKAGAGELEAAAGTKG